MDGPFSTSRRGGKKKKKKDEEEAETAEHVSRVQSLFHDNIKVHQSPARTMPVVQSRQLAVAKKIDPMPIVQSLIIGPAN